MEYVTKFYKYKVPSLKFQYPFDLKELIKTDEKCKISTIEWRYYNSVDTRN